MCRWVYWVFSWCHWSCSTIASADTQPSATAAPSRLSAKHQPHSQPVNEIAVVPTKPSYAPTSTAILVSRYQQRPTAELPTSYNWMLSVLIASLAAYAALAGTGPLNAAETSVAKRAWLATGTVTMGIGVWAMHFIGMLTFTLPVEVGYDVLITAVSMVPAILASGVALQLLSRERIGVRRLILGGGLMGSGIGVMHYTGMAAMRMDALMRYDPLMFIVSVPVAVAPSSPPSTRSFSLPARRNPSSTGRHWEPLWSWASPFPACITQGWPRPTFTPATIPMWRVVWRWTTTPGVWFPGCLCLRLDQQRMNEASVFAYRCAITANTLVRRAHR